MVSSTKTQRVRKAVFPVGGLGTRFLPATKSMPKEMLPVVDKPLIHYAFEEAQKAGIEEFIFITGRNKDAINNHFDHAYELQSVLDQKGKKTLLKQIGGWLPEPGSIVFIRQQEPMGLGHAIWCARNAVGNEPFAVLLADELMLSDVPAIGQMMDVFHQHPTANIIGVDDVAREDTSKYGILDVTKRQGQISKAKGLVEKPKPAEAPSTTAVVGRYILQPEIFEVLSHQAAGTGGEIQITDAINAMLPKTEVYGFHMDGQRFDCGNRVGFLEANIAFALANEEMRDRAQEMLKKYVA